MAVQFSAISNLWTDATWQTVNSTSYLKSEAASTTTTTSYVASQTFTTGVITVEGILLRVKGTTTTPTGTFSVELYNSTGAASVATVTCNATDIINNNTGLEGGWMYFKFSSPVVLLAATAYSIRIKSSVAGTVTVYRDGTAGNWSRGLVTSTTASLAASDDVIICGNITASATTTVNTITFNYTGANAYNSLEVGAYGKLIGQNSAATNYVLTINSAGLFIISHNGIAEFSTTSSRLPSDSTFIITMTNATDGVNYIDARNRSTFRIVGASKTRKCLLTANAAVSATTLTTDVSTGWKNGDNIGIAGTGGISQQQQRTLNADASGTSLSISAGLTYSTEGTSPIQADVVNLTSNFKILGTSISLRTYIKGVYDTVIECDQVEFQYCGPTDAIGAVYVHTNPQLVYYGSTTLTNCAFWRSVKSFFITPNNGVVNSIYIDGVVSYMDGAAGTHFNIEWISTANLYINIYRNNVCIGGNRGASTYNVESTYCIMENNTFANNASYGLFVYGYGKPANNYAIVNNCKIYRCAYGIYTQGANSGFSTSFVNITNFTIFRCTTGIAFFNNIINSTVESCTIFGCTTANIRLQMADDVKFINCSIQGGTTVVAPRGILFDNGVGRGYNVTFERCLIGTITAHSAGDVSADSWYTNTLFNNCTFGSSVLVENPSNLTGTSKIRFQRLNGTVSNHRTYVARGSIINDTTIYNTSPSSIRLTPILQSNSILSTYKMKSTIFQVAVASGSTATVSVKVRKSVAGDGTAYDGSQPRLILKANPSAHGSAYNSDIVCATATNAANGAWETLSYTLPSAVTDNVGIEFYVDCDGTTGWINIDTITVT